MTCQRLTPCEADVPVRFDLGANVSVGRTAAVSERMSVNNME